jgi:hypothetical protein
VRDERSVVVGWVGGYGVDIGSLARQRTIDWDMLVAVGHVEQEPEQV